MLCGSFGGSAHQVSAGAAHRFGGHGALALLESENSRLEARRDVPDCGAPRQCRPSVMPIVYPDTRGGPNTMTFAHRNGAVIRQLVDCS